MFTLNNNEYLATLTNLCLQVITFSSLNFRSPFKAFERQYTKWGDKIATVNAWVADGVDYNLGDADFDNPYNADEPRAYERTITTVLKKRYSLQLSEDLLKGAFEDSNALSAFLTVLTEQLETKAQIDIYQKVIADFALFNPTTNGTKQASNVVTGSIATQSAVVTLYNAILLRATKYRLPNQEYGMQKMTGVEQTEMTATMDKPILYITPELKTAFDTYVNASLFNSSTISLDKYFKDVVVVDVDDNNNLGDSTIAGFIATDDVYRISPRIKEIRNQPNGANLTMNYFYHVWTNAGFTGAGQLSFIGLNN